MEKWINDRIQNYKELLNQDSLWEKMEDFGNIILRYREYDKKMIFAGNGASNTIATHASLDFTNQLAIPCFSFNDASVVTAYSNDFGYDNSAERFVRLYGDDDCYVFISSSGESENLVRAARYANTEGYKVVTFTGFNENNRLKQLGHLNFWVDSADYNVVENIHMVWLSTICDMQAHKEKEHIGVHGRKL
jgi:D-sedoheptulose 7-phosphate isomerase